MRRTSACVQGRNVDNVEFAVWITDGDVRLAVAF